VLSSAGAWRRCGGACSRTLSLLETRDGTIADETFARWMRQDYLFVEQSVQFLGALLARARKRHRDPLAEAIDALRRELALSEQQAREVGVELAGARPAFATHAYMQLLTATALRASYAEAYTLLYVASAPITTAGASSARGSRRSRSGCHSSTTGPARRSPNTSATSRPSSTRWPPTPAPASARGWPSCSS
jgi:hypothetical protein